MAETKTSRSALLADQFTAAQESFIRLVESLSDEQWWFQGVNTPPAFGRNWGTWIGALSAS